MQSFICHFFSPLDFGFWILDYRVSFPLDGKPGVFFFFLLPGSVSGSEQERVLLLSVTQ